MNLIEDAAWTGTHVLEFADEGCQAATAVSQTLQLAEGLVSRDQRCSRVQLIYLLVLAVFLGCELTDILTLIHGRTRTICRGCSCTTITTNARDINSARYLFGDRRMHLILESYHAQTDLVQDRLSLSQIKVLGRVALHAGL